MNDRLVFIGFVLGVWITSVTVLAFHRITEQYNEAPAAADCLVR